MKICIDSGPVATLLERLYANALRIDPTERKRTNQLGLDDADPRFYQALEHAYLPVTPDFGRLLYVIARLQRARFIVEFGTSFGISTIFLAAALRDNGGGQLITTELQANKARLAIANLSAAGLDGLVTVRVGDARETLRHLPQRPIDMLFLDGAKNLYFPLLRMLEPRLEPGAVLLSDNTDMAGADDYVRHVREPSNRWLCAPFFSYALGRHHGHELLLRS